MWLQVKVKVTLQLTASQSVSLGVEPPSGAHDQIFFIVWHLRSCFVGHPLWREDVSVFCICCWPLPARSFSGPSPFELETIFYCLRLETSLFVASYDSQGHGGGIRPRLHTGIYVTFTNWPGITFGTDRTENTVPHCCSSTVAVGTCFLRSRYSVTTFVYLVISRPLPSNGSRCYNTVTSVPPSHL
jgi:hypothetical protein